jgi:hypothetical protein
MFYVCEYAEDRPLRFLAGPYATEAEAVVAAAAYEVDHPEYRMKTQVWTCRAGRDETGLRIDKPSFVVFGANAMSSESTSVV